MPGSGSGSGEDDWSQVDWKTALIVILVVFLVLTVARVDVGGGVRQILWWVRDAIGWVLRALGFSVGTVVSGGAHVVTTGVEIVGGATERVGDSLVDASQIASVPLRSGTTAGSTSESNDNTRHTDGVDDGFDLTPRSHRTPNDRQMEPIRRVQQDKMASSSTLLGSGKRGWCLAGTFEGKRGCVEVDDDRLCTSGQLFATRESCMAGTTV